MLGFYRFYKGKSDERYFLSVKWVTTIAWYANDLGIGSVQGTELLRVQMECSGKFLIVADADPGSYKISFSANDAGIANVIEKIVTVIIE